MVRFTCSLHSFLSFSLSAPFLVLLVLLPSPASSPTSESNRLEVTGWLRQSNCLVFASAPVGGSFIREMSTLFLTAIYTNIVVIIVIDCCCCCCCCVRFVSKFEQNRLGAFEQFQRNDSGEDWWIGRYSALQVNVNAKNPREAAAISADRNQAKKNLRQGFLPPDFPSPLCSAQESHLKTGCITFYSI